MSNSVDEKTSAEKADIELDTSGSHGSMHNKMKQLLASFSALDYISPLEIPNIDLYIEQVTSFLDNELASARRTPDDKTLTKTMINNYAKNGLLPPQEKKKYNKEHVLTLIFIYYFKNMMSISDIHALLSPITEEYFGNKDGFNMEDVYKEVFSLEAVETEKMVKDLAKKYKRANETFKDFPEKDQKYLHTFSLIAMLAYDVYIKKMLIQHMIDENQDE